MIPIPAIRRRLAGELVIRAEEPDRVGLEPGGRPGRRHVPALHTHRVIAQLARRRVSRPVTEVRPEELAERAVLAFLVGIGRRVGGLVRIRVM